MKKTARFVSVALPILVVASFFPVRSARAAISVDATSSKNQDTPSVNVSTAPFSTTSGNELLLAFISADQASSSSTAVTQVTGAGLTWVLVKRTNARPGTAEIWRAFSASPLPGVTVTATLSQSVVSSLTVMSFIGADISGTNGSGAIGATGSANASSGTPTATLVTTRGGSAIVGVGNDYDNAISRTPGSGQTVVHEDLAPVGDTYWVQEQNSPILLSGTSVTISDTAPAGDQYNLSVVEVLAQAGSGGSAFSISGAIIPAGSGSGATVALTQGGATISTVAADSSGNYSFANLANGTYAVTPSKSGFSFSPASQTAILNGTNGTVPTFTASARTWSLSGTITPAGSGSAATLNLTQGGVTISTVSADSSGNYSFANLANGTYGVTPSKSGFTFSPINQTVTVSGGNATVPVFNATAIPTWSISGTISPAASGNGSAVTLSQGGTTVGTNVADSSGASTFTNVVDGDYVVTPSKRGFTFNPANQSLTIHGANVSGINFVAQSSAPPPASIIIDANVSTDQAPETSVVTTPSFSTTSGNELLLAFVGSDYQPSQPGTNVSVTGVSGGGLTWVLVVRTNGQLGTAEIWRAFAPSALSNIAVSATLSQTVQSAITVMSFAGIDVTGTNGSGAIGGIGSANASSGAPTATLVTTRNNSLVLGAGTDYSHAVPRTLPSSQVLIHQDLMPIDDTFWVQRQAGATPLAGTTVTINDTAPTSDRYDLSLVEILANQNTSGIAPTITAQPANQTVIAGQTATFTVAATGTVPLNYQWQKNTVNIPGATSGSYTTPTTTTADSGTPFRVVVSNVSGTATSVTATLTVNPATVAPTITTQPVSQTVTAGQTATFTVTAKGTAPLNYQWQKNAVNISGATSSSYTTPTTTTADSGSPFRVLVSNVSGTATSSTATLTVNPATVAPTITTQPANQTVTAGQTATFTVTATGTVPLSYQWQMNGADITGATSSSYVTPITIIADSGEQFRVKIGNTAGNVQSNLATLTVNPGVASTTDVLTYHYDNLRTGQNQNETILTPANVNFTKFGKLGAFTVDGRVDAQTLYLSGVAIPGVGTKNILYVATEHDSVYAFDADSINGNTSAFLWKASMLGAGESPSDNRGCDQVTPEIGVTSTPVIDRNRGPHGAIYVVAMSKDGSGNYFQRLHALDLTTGAELFSGPMTIQAKFPGSGDNSSGGNVVFDAKQYKERSGLLQLGATLYTTWASHCDIRPYTSWVMSFDANTLAQTSVLNLVPNGSEGAIWMSGTAPAADPSGNIYFIMGNGDFDTALNAKGFPSNGNCGNCYAKLSSSAPITLLDYFTPSNTVSLSNGDVDFGSGGPLLLPDLVDAGGKTRHLAVGSGKDRIIYVVDRDSMGKFNANQNNIYQEINGQLGGEVFSKPSYFNGTVYYGAVGDKLKAFPISGARLAGTPSSQSAGNFGYPGTTPSISANGTTNGIVWAVENGSTAVLHAYNSNNLSAELYNSNQAANSRDNFSGNKFITPMVANGKVFVGTPNSVAVFGLLP